jgi:hypothetical protein
MSPTQQRYRAKRVYEITPRDGKRELRLNDRIVELGDQEFDWYQKVAAWLPSVRGLAELSRDLGMDEAKVPKFIGALAESGLLYRTDDAQKTMTGLEFHAKFSSVLSSWLSEAFEHPFWERMMSGRGSARLFTGWLIELYHYTKNANRHMPLSCAHAHEKPIKQLRAKHYAEEWNHYHYFMKSLKALGFTESQIAESVPLPMTLALSNFMRQAARRDILAYSICSAVLEGTTTDRGTYNPYDPRSSMASRRKPSRRSSRTSISMCSTSTPISSETSSRRFPRCPRNVPHSCSTTGTNWSSTSGSGPTTSRNTIRLSRTLCRDVRSTSSSTEGY